MDVALKTFANHLVKYDIFGLMYSTRRLVAGVAMLTIILHSITCDSSIRRECR